MGFLTSRWRSALSLISHLAVGGDYSIISITSRRRKISNPSQNFSNVFTWSGGLVVLCSIFLERRGTVQLGFWSFQRTSQKREHGFGCGIGVMRIPRLGQEMGFFNLSLEIGPVTTFSLGRCHVPSQSFSNVFTWSSGLVVLCSIFLERRGTVQLGFWSFQRTSQKREHGFGCGIGVMRIPRLGQEMGFLTSRWRLALSLLSHLAVVISLRKVFQMFSLGRRWRDYSLFSTSQHPEKNAEELACFGLC